MAVSKKTKELVGKKYDGLCAYTGKPLDDKWQVDHIHPVSYFNWGITKDMTDVDCLKNLAPAIRIVNHYKRSLDLEGFRRYMLNFHDRLKKLPKNTQIEKTVKRKEYMFKVAELFEITPDKPFTGKFYFETLNTTSNEVDKIQNS